MKGLLEERDCVSGQEGGYEGVFERSGDGGWWWDGEGEGGFG